MSLKTIKREDLPGAPSWVDPLLLGYNQTVKQVNAATNKGGLTLSGNIAGSVREVQVQTQANYASGEFEILEMQSGIQTRANACHILQVINVDSTEAVLSGPYHADWRDQGGRMVVRWISGLAPSSRYTVRFHIW